MSGCSWKAPSCCAILLVASIFSGAAAAAGAGSAEPDYTTLSLEQLSGIKVTSVAKKQQRLSRTAAAVYIIASEDIHRSGLTSVAEVLRLAPGLSVARIDASKWAVASRGFNGRFNNKLMVLIDGRSVYSPIFSGVYWDTAMPLLDDIERIEVIRGAGATMWGANAVNGVINIITRSAGNRTRTGGDGTKTAADTAGPGRDAPVREVVASAGTTERASGEVRGGGSFGSVDYRVYLGGQDTNQLVNASGQGARDGWSSEQAGFRMDTAHGRDAWTLEGDFFRNDRSENGEIPSFQSPPFVTFYTQETGLSGTLAGEWRRQIREGSELRVNAYYDDTDRPESSFPAAHTRTGDLEAQYRFAVGVHNEVLVGAGERTSATRVVGDGTFSISQSSSLINTGSLFAQDEIQLFDQRLVLTGGIKIEHDSLSGWQSEPNARVLWAPSPKHSVWASVSRAVRTPDPYELYASGSLTAIPASPETGGLPVMVTFQGSPGFQPETLKAVEIGYRVQPSPRFSLDWTAFYNDYDHLRSSDPATPFLQTAPQPYLTVPYVFGNFLNADGAGSEMAATWHPVSPWKLSGSYSWLNLHQELTTGAPPGSYPGTIQGSPKSQWKLQSYVNLSKSVQTDVFVYSSSAIQPGSLLDLQALVPSWIRLDVRAAWRVKPSWELSLVGQNLLSARHLEFIPEALSSPSYVKRGVYLRSTWRF